MATLATAWISSVTELVHLNTLARPGAIILPSTFLAPGRTLSFKDTGGSFFRNPLTFSTITSVQVFEDAQSRQRRTDTFGSYTFTAGADSRWYVTGGTTMPTASISSLLAINTSSIVISTGNTTLSTLTLTDRSFGGSQDLYMRSTFMMFGSTNIPWAGTRVASGPTFVIRPQPLFAPNQLANLQLWLDAADVNTIQVTNSIVRQWGDKSGNGRTLTTTLINAGTITFSRYGGIPSILFNSTSTLNGNGAYMRVVSAVNLTNFTVFTVVRSQTSATNQNSLLAVPASGTEYSSTDGFGHFIDSGSDRFYGGGVAEANRVVNLNPSRIDAYPLCLMSFTNTSAGAISSWINGATGSTVTGSARTGTATGFGIGFDINMPAGTIANLTCVSQFSEFIVYNIVLSTFQRQQVEGYLAWKWGLVTSLPASHPYRKFPS